MERILGFIWLIGLVTGAAADNANTTTTTVSTTTTSDVTRIALAAFFDLDRNSNCIGQLKLSAKERSGAEQISEAVRWTVGRFRANFERPLEIGTKRNKL